MSMRLRNRMTGLSLIELMIAMVLGLVIMAGVASIFSANSQINRSAQNVSRVQESARTVFEMIGRDLRETGVNACGRIPPESVHNALNGAGGAGLWWANWSGGMIGYEAGTALPGVLAIGTGVGGRVATSDVVHVMHGSPTIFQVVNHTSTTAPPVVNLGGATLNTLETGDIAIVCDFMMASIFQVTNNRAGTGNGLAHAAGALNPGNAVAGLGGNGVSYAYPPNAVVMRLESSTWFVGNNARPNSGGRSLFRAVSRNAGGTTAPVAEEVVEGVSDLQVQYLLNGAYVDATAIAANAWQNVTAARIQLTLQGTERESDGAGGLTRVTRQFTQVIALRNRV